MMIQVHNRCSDFSSYRAARVKSLFNAESGCNFDLEAELPADDPSWKIGVIVGPSGSGKSSIGRQFWPGVGISNLAAGWPTDAPIVDAIAPTGDFNAVTGALAAVGLGDVPAWLRPFHVLSCGEQFRAGLARLIADPPERVIVDEFTSALDRQIARFGALAFAKSWRRLPGSRQCLILTCHRDVVDWITPDWTFDTATGTLTKEGVQRPRFDLEIYQTNWRFWPIFEPHHYLKMPLMPCARCYVGVVDGQPVCHVAMSSRHKGKGAVEARGCRLVVLPEWQGAGVGMRFLNAVCELNLQGAEGSRFPGQPVTTLFHTSHPGLAASLRRDRRWRQVSANLYGEPRARCFRTMAVSNARKLATEPEALTISGAAYGGHFRAVQGFRYVGGGGGERMKKIRTILCGQRSFGAAVYGMLRKRPGIDLAAVYAPAGDKLAGLAELYHTPLRIAGTLRADTMPAGCDLLIAAHSHDFVSAAVRNRLRLGAIGYHPSLLPLHRGRDAVRWTIRDRDRIAGGTVFWLSDTVDGGPIAAQDWCLVRPDDDASELWRRELFPMGLRLLESVLDDIERGELVMRPQLADLATWEPSFTGAPRLFRPELLQLGELPEGYRVTR